MNFVIQWPKKLQVARFITIVLFNYLFMAAKETNLQKVSTIIVVVHNIKWNINASFQNRELKIYFIFYKYLLESCQICKSAILWICHSHIFSFWKYISKMEVTQQFFIVQEIKYQQLHSNCFLQCIFSWYANIFWCVVGYFAIRKLFILHSLSTLFFILSQRHNLIC